MQYFILWAHHFDPRYSSFQTSYLTFMSLFVMTSHIGGTYHGVHVHQSTEESLRATHEYFWKYLHVEKMLGLRQKTHRRVDTGMQLSWRCWHEQRENIHALRNRTEKTRLQMDLCSSSALEGEPVFMLRMAGDHWHLSVWKKHQLGTLKKWENPKAIWNYLVDGNFHSITSLLPSGHSSSVLSQLLVSWVLFKCQCSFTLFSALLHT